MLFVLSTIANPCADQLLLFGRLLPRCIVWRHDLFWIAGVYPRPNLALLSVSSNDSDSFLARRKSRLGDIESQIGFSVPGVLTVATEARGGKDRPDIAIELDGLCGLSVGPSEVTHKDEAKQ